MIPFLFGTLLGALLVVALRHVPLERPAPSGALQGAEWNDLDFGRTVLVNAEGRIVGQVLWDGYATAYMGSQRAEFAKLHTAQAWVEQLYERAHA